MMLKKAIKAPAFLNEAPEYKKAFSRGIRVNIGSADMLFISGTASLDSQGKSRHLGDIKNQTRRTFGNIAGLLKSEGAAWRDVVQTRCYLKDMMYYNEFNEVRNWFYKKQKLNPFPASVCVQAGLCRPELLVEIEVIALIQKC